MLLDSLGGQRIGIISETVVLDVDGQPVLDEYRQSTITTSTVWVAGCLFELQTPNGLSDSVDAASTLKTEIGWCLMPVSSGAVPAVTDGGQRTTVAVADIRLLHYDGGKPFQVQGRAAIEVDDDGREDHVFVLSSRVVG